MAGIKLSVLTASLAVFLFSFAAGASSWQVDTAHTRVGFNVSHLGINTVHGVFKRYSAEVEADEKGKLTSVNATVKVASVDTGIEKRDTHLRAADVFNAEKYPDITVKTTQIIWNGKQFHGTAELTIKGTTKTVKFKGKLTGVKSVEEGGKTTTRVGYQVTAKVDRTTFGISFGGFSEGLGMVGESVNIVLNVELVR